MSLFCALRSHQDQNQSRSQRGVGSPGCSSRAVGGAMGCVGRQDTVRGHTRPSQELSSRLARKGGHHGMPHSKGHHGSAHPQAQGKQRFAGDDQGTQPCPAGTAQPCLLPRSCGATILHQRSIWEKQDFTNRTGKAQTPETSQCTSTHRCSLLRTATLLHPQTPRCPYRPPQAVMPPIPGSSPPLTGQILLPELGQPSAPSTAGAGPGGRIQPPTLPAFIACRCPLAPAA